MFCIDCGVQLVSDGRVELSTGIADRYICVYCTNYHYIKELPIPEGQESKNVAIILGRLPDEPEEP